LDFFPDTENHAGGVGGIIIFVSIEIQATVGHRIFHGHRVEDPGGESSLVTVVGKPLLVGVIEHDDVPPGGGFVENTPTPFPFEVIFGVLHDLFIERSVQEDGVQVFGMTEGSRVVGGEGVGVGFGGVSGEDPGEPGSDLGLVPVQVGEGLGGEPVETYPP
jgi:hypothetical protein